MYKKRHIPSVIFGKFLSRIYVFIVLLIVLIPLIWMFSLSFRTSAGINQSRFLIIPLEIETGNYAEAVRLSEERDLPIARMFLNSSIVVFPSVLATVIIATIASYALAKFRFKGRNIIYNTIIITMMIPMEATIIPIFLFVSRTKMLFTYHSVILAYTAVMLPFSIVIIRSFFLKIPSEIMESARIDGATEWGVFLRVMLPLAKPAIATTTIMVFMFNWNEFILALILMLKKALYTLPVGLQALVSELYTPWGVYSAMVFITIGPIMLVFVIFQEWFIKGLTQGALKG